jgi:WD40 repeat protein
MSCDRSLLVGDDDDGPMPVAEDVDAAQPEVVELEDSYQDSRRFKTWRKHVKDLYQTSVHIDTVWETPPVQFMPFITCKEHCATQTILCGTRTGGSEQNYLQLANITLPTDASQIEEVGFHETTGEVGGYGMAPSHCTFRIERRMAHSGDVLAARYMHANPLVLATCSSDGNAYIFDWSRISLLKPPNAPERPLCSLPPNSITDDSTAEEKAQYYRRLRAYRNIMEDQERWDRSTHAPQHVLSLNGSCGKPQTMDFDTSTEGKLIVGSDGKVCMWHVGSLPKDVIPKAEKNGLPPPQVSLAPTWTSVDPLPAAHGESQQAPIADVKFKWCDTNVFLAASLRGAILRGDLRQPGMEELFSVGDNAKGEEVGAACLAMPYEDTHTLFVGGTDGHLREYDARRPQQVVSASLLHCHSGEVTVAQCCPHSSSLIATGGEDGYCAIFNIKDRSSPKLLFKHSAHIERIMDMCWNWQDVFAGMLVSSDSTSMTVWRPREVFFQA